MMTRSVSSVSSREVNKDLEFAPRQEAVECLGTRFETQESRCAHYLGLLREHLEAPASRDCAGFPNGTMQDILRLSDPPFYTACPNPFLREFISIHGKQYESGVPYLREPLAIDVSEGKTDPIYTAHSYHTKVPHKAIVRAILHYTEPGDVVLDGFAGSGMTGVAAQTCGHPDPEFKRTVESEWAGSIAPKWGGRRFVLNDLGPAATFISSNYTLPFDLGEFQSQARRLLDDLRSDISWMYETTHLDGRTKGTINYTVWSEVFSCPTCSREIIFSDEAMEAATFRVKEEFPCPECAALLTKDNLQRRMESLVDAATGRVWKRIRFVPVLINYKVAGQKYEKRPDASDIAVLDRIAQIPLPPSVPTDEFPIAEMYHGSRLAPKGFTHTHQLYLPRAAQALGRLWALVSAVENKRTRNMLLFFIEQAVWGLSMFNRYQPIQQGRPGGSQVNRQLTGVFYVPSQHAECSPWYNLEAKLGRLGKAFRDVAQESQSGIITTGTAARLDLPLNSIDYIFTDPPFGENIFYADLNFLVESWHRIRTDAKGEAVVDRAKGKGLPEYQHLMQRCFEEYYRVLKPGRWMTLVFHNSRNSVWAAIQEALTAAGFVVADVRTLDKQQGSYRQVTSTAVKQDLVISCYKPNGGLEQRFELEKGTEDGVWDFVRTHLRQLPVFVSQKGKGEAIAERQSYMLFDRMVAFHVQRGILVPVSSAEFYEGLTQRFEYRDGMYFLADQIDEYDKKKHTVSELKQLELIVRDEFSAVQWLRQQLTEKPQHFADLQPQFMRETGGWSKEEQRLELSEILRLNFFCYDGKGEVPVQIRNYLSKNFHELRGLAKDAPALQAKANDRWYVPDPNKAVDLEKIRERELLKTFEEYRASGVKKIKVPRLEALRAGFRRAWDQRDYAMIVEVAAKIPETILQEDSKLLMFYDNAATRLGVG